MWKNEMTDEVFETVEEAVDAIYDELDDYTEELYQALSECTETWIFQHLTPDAQEEILQKWVDNVVGSYLSECDDE